MRLLQKKRNIIVICETTSLLQHYYNVLKKFVASNFHHSVSSILKILKVFVFTQLKRFLLINWSKFTLSRKVISITKRNWFYLSNFWIGYVIRKCIKKKGGELAWSGHLFLFVFVDEEYYTFLSTRRWTIVMYKPSDTCSCSWTVAILLFGCMLSTSILLLRCSCAGEKPFCDIIR